MSEATERKNPDAYFLPPNSPKIKEALVRQQELSDAFGNALQAFAEENGGRVPDWPFVTFRGGFTSLGCVMELREQGDQR